MRASGAVFLVLPVTVATFATFLYYCSHLPPVHAEDRAELRYGQGQVAPSAAPTIQVYSRETVVDVTVLDKDGKPVPGLTKDDFRIEEDGKPEAIHSFEEIAAGARTAATQMPQNLPPLVYTNRQAHSDTGTLNIIVMDTVNMSPMWGMRAKKEATDYISTMPAGTRVALLTLGNELKFVQGFTTDREVLIAALNDRNNTVMPAGAAAGLCPDGMQAHLTIQALLQIGALVEHAPGRKNVLWFTGEKSALPAEQCAVSAAKRVMYQEALALLATARVSVFAIDVSGVVVPDLSPNPESASAAIIPEPSHGERLAAMMTPKSISSEESGKWINRAAEDTGGRVFARSNDFQGEIGQAMEMGTNYYSISYVPEHGNDGNDYHVSVKVDRPGLTLLYRPTYGALDTAKIAADSGIPTTLDATTPDPTKNTMVASMARFAPIATQILFDVKVTSDAVQSKPAGAAVMGFPVAAVKGKPMVRYDISYSVPANQLAFTGADGIYSGRLEFDVVASDVYGKLITSISRTVPLTVAAGDYGMFAETPLHFSQQIDLPAGQTYLRIGVLDRTSNKVGTLEVPLKVATGSGGSVAGKQ